MSDIKATYYAGQKYLLQTVPIEELPDWTAKYHVRPAANQRRELVAGMWPPAVVFEHADGEPEPERERGEDQDQDLDSIAFIFEEGPCFTE